MRCSACGFDSPEAFRFCGGCGAPVEAAPPKPPPRVAAGTGHDSDDAAERRRVSVLFCDLAGSTALSERLDPEDLRDVLHAYQKAAVDVIQGLEGHVAQYLGDGLLVYFGHPVAHEDDARRAVSAGLRIVQAVGELSATLEGQRGFRLAVRVGIETGEVVTGRVGAGDRREDLALGYVPNVAARLQAAAEPGTVVVSDETRRFVEGFFTWELVGELSLKGVGRPVRAWRPVSETAVRTRFEQAQAKGSLSTFVGREEELAELRRRHDDAAAGRGQVVLVSGEAGIGKSRLHDVLRAETPGATHLTFRCSAEHRTASLNPMIDLLQRSLGLRRDDTPASRAAKLAMGLRQWGVSLDATLPALATLLSLPVPAPWAPLTGAPQALKEATLDALLAVVFAQADRRCVVVAVEDVHWADPSTLELLDLLVQRLPRRRVLLLVTFRPSFAPPWSAAPNLARIELEKLGSRQAAGLVASVVGAESLPQDVLDEIVRRTDGIPLFVEELTKMLLEAGLLERVGEGIRFAAIPTRSIPLTLQDSLMARLDQLPRGKDVAQLGAVLGRNFGYPLLKAVAGLSDEELEPRLDALVDAELLFRHGHLPDSTFTFKHALVQDAAYESLLRSRRRQLHEKVARVLRSDFPETAETEPELLAHHFELGGLTEEAIEFSGMAGRRAMGRSALAEAVHHYEKATSLLANLPETPERDGRELEMRAALGVALIGTRGYSTDEVASNYSRAAELCRDSDDAAFKVRWGIWAVHIMRGDLAATTEMAEWFRRYVEEPHDARTRLIARISLGGWLFYRGRIAEGLVHLEQARRLFDPQEHQGLAREFGGSGGFYAFTIPCWAHVLGGRLDSARAAYDELLALAATLDDPYTLVESMTFGIVVGHARGDVDLVADVSERVIEKSREHRLIFTESAGTCGRGWARAERGDVEAGLADLQAGLAMFRRTGTRLVGDYYALMLAERLLAAGRIEEGLELASEIVRVSESSVGASWLPEAQRLRGEFLRQAGRRSEADACFETALRVAREHGSTLYELRGATSRARLLAGHGRRGEAVELLTDVLSRITEARDTRDVRTAFALLADLGTEAPGARLSPQGAA